MDDLAVVREVMAILARRAKDFHSIHRELSHLKVHISSADLAHLLAEMVQDGLVEALRSDIPSSTIPRKIYRVVPFGPAAVDPREPYAILQRAIRSYLTWSGWRRRSWKARGTPRSASLVGWIKPGTPTGGALSQEEALAIQSVSDETRYGNELADLRPRRIRRKP